MQGVAPQNRHIISVAEAFLNVHWDKESPLLLGYSGGPDSKALLYALLEGGCKNLHLAHVDHGWREESRDEALEIQREAAQLELPFHTIRLEKEGRGNPEDLARKGRIRFFQSLHSRIPFQAVLLAHHGDDLAETVLKRVFEGAHLVHLGGMEPISKQGEMTIWRPLLRVRRSEVLQFLEERELKPFWDATNEDPTYLRSRMRLEMFPYLSRLFGKEFVENLQLLSERSAELKEYLDQKIGSLAIEEGVLGLKGLHRLERRHLLQKAARKENLNLTRPVLETLLDWAEEGGGKKRLEVGGRKIFVEKDQIFLNVN